MFFIAKIFNMHIISMGLTCIHLYVNVCRGVFRTQSNTNGRASLQKSQKSFIVDAELGSRYISGLGFTVEKVYRSHYLSDIVKVDFKILSLRSRFSN